MRYKGTQRGPYLEAAMSWPSTMNCAGPPMQASRDQSRECGKQASGVREPVTCVPFGQGRELRCSPPSRSAQLRGTGSHRCREPVCRRDEWTWAAQQRGPPAGSCPTEREETGSRPDPTPRGFPLALACGRLLCVWNVHTLGRLGSIQFQFASLPMLTTTTHKRLVNAHDVARQNSLKHRELAEKDVLTQRAKLYTFCLKEKLQDMTDQQHLAAETVPATSVF